MESEVKCHRILLKGYYQVFSGKKDNVFLTTVMECCPKLHCIHGKFLFIIVRCLFFYSF